MFSQYVHVNILPRYAQVSGHIPYIQSSNFALSLRKLSLRLAVKVTIDGVRTSLIVIDITAPSLTVQTIS